MLYRECIAFIRDFFPFFLHTKKSKMGSIWAFVVTHFKIDKIARDRDSKILLSCVTGFKQRLFASCFL